MSKEMAGVVKAGLLIFAILYFISPIDLMPGVPFDDILVFVMQFILSRKITDNTVNA